MKARYFAIAASALLVAACGSDADVETPAEDATTPAPIEAPLTTDTAFPATTDTAMMPADTGMMVDTTVTTAP